MDIENNSFANNPENVDSSSMVDDRCEKFQENAGNVSSQGDSSFSAADQQDKVEQQRFEMADHFHEKNEEKINSSEEFQYHPADDSNQNTTAEEQPQDYSLSATASGNNHQQNFDNDTTTSNEIIPHQSQNNFSSSSITPNEASDSKISEPAFEPNRFDNQIEQQQEEFQHQQHQPHHHPELGKNLEPSSITEQPAVVIASIETTNGLNEASEDTTDLNVENEATTAAVPE